MKIKTYFKESLNYLKKSRNYLLFSVILLLASVIFGLFFPIFFKSEIMKFIEELTLKTAGMNALELISFIFLNNLKSSFLFIFLGIFLGVFPFLMILINGYLIGFVLHYAIISEGFFVIWKLFPHGIFELPAILIAVGLGLRIGLEPIFNLFSKKSIYTFKQNLFKSLKVFLLIIVPLLIIAAIIEGILVFWLR